MERITKKTFFIVLLVSTAVIQAAQDSTASAVALPENAQDSRPPRKLPEDVQYRRPQGKNVCIRVGSREWYAVQEAARKAVKGVDVGGEPEVAVQDLRD